MITFNRRTKIFVCKHPTNLRLSYDGLFEKVKKVLKKNPFSGHIFLFVNKTRTACKALYYDQTGLVILSKRMEKSRIFCKINPSYKKELTLTESEFGLYFEGANLEKRFIDTVGEIKKKSPNSLPFFQKNFRINNRDQSARRYHNKSSVEVSY